MSGLQSFLSLLPLEVSDHLTPVTREQLGQAFLLHLSKDTELAEFSPVISARTLATENRSVPRIAACPTLAGAILGYCSDVSDFFERPTTMSLDNKRKITFKGGWQVYGLPYDIALKPSKKLLPDVDRTDEHWLVTYDENTISYRPVPIAKFFYNSVKYIANGRQPPLSEIEMMVEVLGGIVLNFDGKTKLHKGYWRLKVVGLHLASSWNRIKSVEATRITSMEYNASKQLTASLLSREPELPVSMQW